MVMNRDSAAHGWSHTFAFTLWAVFQNMKKHSTLQFSDALCAFHIFQHIPASLFKFFPQSRGSLEGY
jgi:hypothetical protein